jgi:hypothetical protein
MAVMTRITVIGVHTTIDMTESIASNEVHMSKYGKRECKHTWIHQKHIDSAVNELCTRTKDVVGIEIMDVSNDPVIRPHDDDIAHPHDHKVSREPENGTILPTHRAAALLDPTTSPDISELVRYEWCEGQQG